ncbi:hypothetical protein [Borreliella burgdorferi]|uniref:hypothetical protein n=1 Tax=Borreliella burgdorferi TaxID=139 RepID=UPI00017F4658|nr:hypothetical protein [Borreliella burgdorferi]ACO38221.1 conserved hypothetical protein [Borreliella burgdorferi 29805]MCD2376984.1 hypothetical protein [Borreliella burgdorferi]MCD2398599.1 hypothetical protein [Borreliella burgdorferi]MDO7272931.1 hypothetical protein [Borreliella burgdorferi]PRR00700.1 hypothetical protein CV678_06065 [Borreliella burgdorferi]
MRCAKTLTANNIESYNQNFGDIKTNIKNFEDHFMKEYFDFILRIKSIKSIQIVVLDFLKREEL